MWRACEHFHIVPAVHAAQHAWEPVWLHGVDITLGTAKANPTNMTMIPRIDKCSPVPKPRHQVQVVGVGFLDMATCEVCGDGFADDAEKHLCSPSRDSCSHVCHADCLQQYRLKQGCPMHDCPFCLQNEERFPGRGWWCRFARDGDWGSNGSRGCGWGGKKKDQRRDSFACPCGWGPSGQEVSNQRKPASRTTQPSAAHPKVPKPRKPSLHTGWKWSSPLVHSKLWDWHLRPESDQQGIYHDEGSYARHLPRHVGVLGLQGWSTKPFVASHQEHISRAWKPRGFLSNCSECSLERPQGPPRCGIRLCTTPCRSTWLAGMKHKAFRCFTPRAHIKGLEAQRLLIKLFWMQPWKTPGTTTLWHQTLPSELEKCCPCLSKSAWEPLPARKVGSLRHSWRRSSATLVGWSIHAGTRLRLQPDEEHQRGCVVQIVCAGDPSMRKSSLKDFTSKKLLSHADVPAVIKAGGTTCTDATIKGIRASIKEYAWAGIISDEIATTICRDIREGDPTQVCITATKKRCALGWTAKMTRQSLEMVPRRWLITPSFTKCMDRCRFVSMCSSRLQACFPRESMRRGKQGQWQVTLISRASPAKSSWLTSFIKWGAWQATRTKTTILTSSPCPCSGRLCRESPTSFTRITRM